MTPATLSPSPLAYEKLIHPAKMPCITTWTESPVDNMNKSTSDDKYSWLDPDDIRRNMTDKEILQMKLNLKDSVLDQKGKEEFLEKVEQFTDVFSLRDEIGTCPFIEVHLKLKDETPFFVRPYPMREEQKKVIQKKMDRLEHLGIIHKGLTGYSSLVVLVKWKNQNLYRVCSDFCILKEKLAKINHAFPLVRDCIEQLGRKKCHYLSTIVCYTPLKDKCDTIRNLESPKTLRQTRAFYGMVNFLSSYLPNLRRLLIPNYDLQKKAKKFKWTEEAKKAFNKIKKLFINPPVLKAPTPDGLFQLESDTLREGMGGTLLQKQGDE